MTHFALLRPEKCHGLTKGSGAVSRTIRTATNWGQHLMLSFPSRTGRSNRLSRLSLCSSAAIALTLPAVAQDAEISEDRDTAVTTSEFLGASPGILSLLDGVTLTAPTGPVITVNGPHSLTLSGTVQSFDSTSGIGVFVDTDFALEGDLILDGGITLNGPEDFELDLGLETTNSGLLIEGANTYTGSLTLSSNSAISVWGADSAAVRINSAFNGNILADGTMTVLGNRGIGVALNAPLTGNLTISGDVIATNPDSIGVAVNGPIDGAFVLSGTMQVGETPTVDDDGNAIDAIPGIAALEVTNSISEGILFQGVGVEFTEDGDGDDSTTLVDSVVSTNGGTTAALINNENGDGDLIIGLVEGLDYGLVSRGRIAVNGTSVGLPGIGFEIYGRDASARTLIEGGIHFDTGILDVSVIDADATGIIVGDFAEVPELYNRGTIIAETLLTTSTADDGTITYGPGGDATAISVAENGVLTSIINEESIQALAGGPDGTATVVVDRSGTLTNVRNEGVWRALTANPSGETFTGANIALDASANTSGVTLFNSGTMVGDVLLGAGDDTVTFESGTLDGDIDFGAGANSFSLSGTSEFTGSLLHQGTLDLTVSGADLELGLDETVNVTSARFEDASTLSVLLDPQNDAQGRLVASGAVFVAGDTSIDADLNSFVFTETTYSFLEAGDLTVDTEDLSGLLSETPFLYDTTLALSETDPNNLELTVRPKTSDELGLDRNPTLLYEHFLDTALDPNDQLENALTGLTTQEGTNDAFTALVGDASSASMDLALVLGDVQQTRQRDALAGFIRQDRRDQVFWAQQVATYANGTSSNESDWKSSLLSVGVAVGADLHASENFAWGLSGGFLLSGISRDQDVGDELSVFTPFLGAYSMVRSGNLYAGLSATAAFHDIDRERTIAIGNTTLEAESATNAIQFLGTLSVGYQLQAGKFSLRPEIGVTGTYFRESSYLEEGAASANLRVGSRSLSQLDGFASISAGFDFTWREGANPTFVRPELFAQYQTALLGGNPGNVDIGFAATDTTVDFAIDEIGENVKAAGLALRIFGSGTDAAVRYTYREKDFLESHEASLNFRLSF